MDRRRFLGTAAAGGAGFTLGAGGCAPSDAGGEAGGGDEGAMTIRPFELDEVTVDALQASMASGERTARSITESCLQRIEEMDGQGPELRSIIETNPDALQIA
ncbi:MAG: twin-arginine translocation signal domain-containing protein, partial [Gemmatimonadetes bacterium]|nr:twin-arginine translocation signal domain-containing protein [Gemmatimonadota bacterium]